MRLYESVFIARQDISTGQVDALCEEFTGIITEGGGTIHKHEYWGLKTLAYRIKKNRKGHYIMFNIEADAQTMAEYQRKLGLNEDVIRVLTINIDRVDDEPSIMIQAKSDRPAHDDDSQGTPNHVEPQHVEPPQDDPPQDNIAVDTAPDESVGESTDEPTSESVGETDENKE
jgi:small subunit ribosomal protein S6